MTNSTYSIDISSVRPLSSVLTPTPVSELPESLFEQIIDAQKTMLEMDYTQKPDTANNPTYAGYANIVVNGKVVAEIDNHGYVTSSNATANKITAAIEKADALAGSQYGPVLAQIRAEQIAQALGGTIEKQTTALTQSAYNQIPQPKATLDWKAMITDARYTELEELRKNHTAFLAQQIAQETQTADN